MYVIRPHKMWSLFKTVSGAAAATTYEQSWLTDGIPGRPFKGTGTGGALTISGTAGLVDTLIIANHNVWSPATVAVSGGITTSITIPAARPNNIPYCYFARVGSPVSVSSLTFTITGAASDMVIGEILAGLSESWDLLESDNDGTYNIFPIKHDDVEHSSVPPYSSGIEQRTLSGSNYADLTQKQFIDDWVAASWDHTRPSVIIPNEADNDAWVVDLDASVSFTQKRGDPARLYMIRTAFTEHPRRRW